METTLIAGGSGFIGSHLCEFFLKKGHHVICLDNLITGDCKNVEHIMSDPNFTFIYDDVSTTNFFGSLDGDLKQIDNVLHFASPASPIDYQNHPWDTITANICGLSTLISLSEFVKIKRILFASTSEIYGDPLEHPQKETYWGNVNPFGPRSMYDESKRMGETILSVVKHKFDFSIHIVRIFNTYGPRMRVNDGRVLPVFISQALENKDITIFGDGSQTRSFCYVDDLVRGIYELLYSNYEFPVNLGNPSEISILDFGKKILELTNSSSKITYLNLPEDDPKVRKPDITRAKEILKWEPTISLNEGLKLCIPYFKDILDNSNNK